MKEKAILTETTVDQPRDLGIGKELRTSPLWRRQATPEPAPPRRRMHQPRPRRGTAALEILTSPVISLLQPRPGHALSDPRVQALLAACCTLSLRLSGLPVSTCGISSPPSSENIPKTCRRPDQLRPAQAPRPSDHLAHPAQSHLTAQPDGLSMALFFTRLTRRVIFPHSPRSPAPALRPAAPCSRPRAPTTQPSPSSPPKSHSAYRDAPPPSASHLRHQSLHAIQLDSIFNIPAGKDNLCARAYVIMKAATIYRARQLGPSRWPRSHNRLPVDELCIIWWITAATCG